MNSSPDKLLGPPAYKPARYECFGTWPTATERNLIRACCLEGNESLKSFRLWLDEGYDQSDLPLYLHRLIPTLNLRVPPTKEFDQIRERYQAIYRHTWASNRIRMKFTREAIDLLESNGIKVAVHKGILLCLTAYPSIGNRFMEDSDILISPKDKSKALNLMYRLGWEHSRAVSTQQLPILHSADLGRRRGEALDLHWYAFKDCRNSDVQSGIMEELETIPFCGRPCLAISTNTLLYQTLISPVRDEAKNLSWLVDAYFLLKKQANKIDFLKICHLAHESEYQLKLNAACEIFESVFETKDLNPLKVELAKLPLSKFEKREFQIYQKPVGSNIDLLLKKYTRFIRLRRKDRDSERLTFLTYLQISSCFPNKLITFRRFFYVPFVRWVKRFLRNIATNFGLKGKSG